MEQELAYSFHLGSDKNKSKLAKKVSKGNVSGTTSFSNNAIQNAKDLSKANKHNLRDYDNQKELCGELWIDSNRLFVQADGKPMHPSTISKWFVKFVEQIGLPVINFHGLRHTNATLLIAQNIEVPIVSARLGHAQITTTLNFYVHPIIAHNKTAGFALENLLLPGRQ